jgi:hypothetical protein
MGPFRLSAELLKSMGQIARVLQSRNRRLFLTLHDDNTRTP